MRGASCSRQACTALRALPRLPCSWAHAARSAPAPTAVPLPRWRDVRPEDKDLRRYREWLESTGGLGTGLTRHRTMAPAAP